MKVGAWQGPWGPTLLTVLAGRWDSRSVGSSASSAKPVSLMRGS